MAQRCLRGSSVQFARLATLAKTILIGRLQAKAKVLLWLAWEPLNLPRSGRIIAGGSSLRRVPAPGVSTLIACWHRRFRPTLDQSIHLSQCTEREFRKTLRPLAVQ